MEITVHNQETASGAFSGNSSSDVRAEFQALVSGCGVYPLSTRAQIQLTGKDRVRWLNGMVTNNVRDLAVNQGVYAFLLNPQGHILGELYAFNRGDSLVVDTEQSQLAKIVEIFDRYIIMDDVNVEDVSAKFATIGITGPKSRGVLEAAGIIFADLQPLETHASDWQQTKLTVIRDEHAGPVSYKIWTAPEHAAGLLQALLRSGGTLVDSTALELFRIALGIPRYMQDIRERDLPQETEQARALNFNKGCYVGQEIVERIRSRGAVHRKFTGFLVDGGLPAAGSKVQADGKDVGEITSAASLPVSSGELSVALGYIRREVGIPGKEVFVAGKRATVEGLPFKTVFA